MDLFRRILFSNSSVISFGKLRGSYGTTGNDQIGDYQFISRYSFTSSPYQDVSIQPTALFNPDFALEITSKMEAAVELGMLNNRISFSASWYRNRSSNQLVPYPLPYGHRLYFGVNQSRCSRGKHRLGASVKFNKYSVQKFQVVNEF